MESRERLFSHLREKRELITYVDAYVALFGPLKQAWRNQVDAPKLLNLANSGRWRAVGPLSIRLDALIVDHTSLKPSGGHFTTHRSYSKSAWEELFGKWSRCRCSAADRDLTT